MIHCIAWPPEDNESPREILTDPDLFRAQMDALFTGQDVFVSPL